MARAVVAIPAKYREHVDEEIALVGSVYDVVDYFIVKKPNRKYYIPQTRLNTLKSSNSFDSLVILDKLKPRYVVNIYRELKREVIDRVQLILKIFAEHAGSREARLQIELATLKHELPLIRETIRYMKLGELPGFLGGGRYAIDKYYRTAKSRIARITRELEKLRRIREVRRANRKKAGLPHVALVGYTCAGKTSLFNRLTKSLKPVGPEPFTTLSPKASAIVFDGYKFILVDTVGFIRDIPPEIIEAFYATLEEVIDSDLIVLVIDSSKGIKSIELELRESLRILSNIGVHGKAMVVALNKVDLVDDNAVREAIYVVNRIIGSDTPVVSVSALRGYNMDLLAKTIVSKLRHRVEARAV